MQINSLRTFLPFYKLAKIYLNLNILPYPVSHTQAPGPVNFSFIDLHADPSPLPPSSFKLSLLLAYLRSSLIRITALLIHPKSCS